MSDLPDVFPEYADKAARKRPAPTRILAIDPGNEHSAWVRLDSDDRKPIRFAKEPSAAVLDWIDYYRPAVLAIEMIASYGMPVGREVFDTCVWIGRYAQHAHHVDQGIEVRLVFRQPVKIHHCHSSKAKDSNVRQALVDRFAPGQPNYGKGTKAAPGWFYGFSADIWQSYALGVYVADSIEGPDW